MSRQHFPRWMADVAVVIVAGLSLGLGAARFWRADTYSPAQEPARLDVSRPAQDTAEQSRAAKPDPAPPGQAAGRRALLIGVTKYDHLPRDKHLDGPANDVRLMRRLLLERFQFPAEGIVTLTEDEGSPARRPTRANIEREFRRLADQAREGDQVVILLAGHGSQEPENPPDPVDPEPDGLDEIFLPADVSQWQATPGHVPNAIVDNDLGAWLRAITAKRAYVWAIFDCCHSGTMTRGTEVVRELPPEMLVPREELAKARQRAAQRQERTRGGPSTEPAPFVPREPSDYLVAVYACRPHETTPESPQPPTSPKAEYHGLLTYSLVDVLTKSAESKAPLDLPGAGPAPPGAIRRPAPGLADAARRGQRAGSGRPGNGGAGAVSSAADPGPGRLQGQRRRPLRADPRKHPGRGFCPPERMESPSCWVT